MPFGGQTLAQQSAPKRSRRPSRRFPYKQHDIAYTNPADGTRLVGTLTITRGGAGRTRLPYWSPAPAGQTATLPRMTQTVLRHRGLPHATAAMAVLRVDSRKADEYFIFTAGLGGRRAGRASPSLRNGPRLMRER